MENKDIKSYIHGKLLELLIFTDGVCRKENIPYSLYGGTMLGAVRHSGFIPWDDDADIVLHRDDLNRFKESVGKHLEGTPYALCRHGRVDGICFAEPQISDGKTIENLCLDLFVVDSVPDDDRLFAKQVFGLKKLQGMMKKGKIDWSKYSLKGKLLVLGTKLLGAFQSEEKLAEKYVRLSTKYNGAAQTKRVFVSNDLYEVFDKTFDRELYSDTEDMAFETEKFPVYKAYDKIMTELYGDYMTPPPAEQQVFSHTQVVADGKSD